MKNLNLKIKHLKWLQSIGIEYYCSLNQKESKNNLIQSYNELNTIKDEKNSLIKNMEIVMTKTIKQEKTQKKNTSIITPSEEKARLLANAATSLNILRQSIEDFDGIELKTFANNMVFSDGNPEAKIMLIGEAPGASEDAQGIPFCGESGQLLDQMLNTINISRKTNAYITNTVFWRPPANRPPTIEEINICRPFVEKHIALIKPKLIVLVGGTATTALLGKNEGITFIRKNNYSYINQYLDEQIVVTALFHPAYLLRQPMQKKATWYDLLKLKDLIKELNI